MIKEKQPSKYIEIDITGPQGNAFNLIAIAKNLSNQLNLNFNEIKNEMISSNYENLITVFDKYFGDFVIIYK